MAPRLHRLALGIAAALTLAGCAYDDYGHGGVSVGYGSAGYYDPYYYGYPSYGWYDGYYYPGTGYYVYDRGGRRHAMRDHDRRRWIERRGDRRDWQHGDRRDRSRWEGRADRRIEQPRSRPEGWSAPNIGREQREVWRQQRLERRQQQVEQRAERRSSRIEQRADRAERRGQPFSRGHRGGRPD